MAGVSRRSVRALTAVATAAVSLAIPLSAAWAAGEVTVAPQGGEQVGMSLAGLESSWDVRERTYTVRGAGGETAVTVTGMSIDALLDRAGIDPYGFEDVTIAGGGRTVTLGRDQMTDPDAFADGRPVFYLDAEGAHFLRPSTGPDDLNADDLIAVGDGPIEISLRAPSKLAVRASASRTHIEKGQRVRFSATVSGAGDAERVRVSWSFDDRGAATGTRVTHRFTRPGTYKVVVGATSDANPTGADDVVTIQVGKPPKGPDREGGGTNPDASAPDSGAATGATGATGTPSAPAAATPPAPAQTPAPRHAAAPEPPKAPPAAKPAPVLPKDQQKAVQDAPPTGAPQSVEGVLLTEASAAPTPAKAAAVRAARTGNPVEETAGAATIPPGAVGTMAVLALVGLGAWWERRQIPRRRGV